MKKNRHIGKFVTAFTLCTLLGSCGGGSDSIAAPPPPPPVAAVSVVLSSTNLTIGQTIQAAATTKDAAGNVLTGRTVSWNATNTAVATVNASGVVTAVGAGNANVTATSEGQSGSATLTVTPVPVASVSVTLAASSLTVGATTQATATTKDANGNVLTGRSVSWTSSNTAVATVNASGVVTAVGAGNATITATSEGQGGSSAITAATPIGGIVSNNTALTLANSPYRLTQNLQIADGATLTIEPGVQIFGATKNIEVWGQLLAVGTPTANIRFDSTNVVPRGAASQANPFLIRIEFSQLFAGTLYNPTGNAIYGSLILRDSRLLNVGGYLYIWYPVADCFIERNVFQNSGGLSIGVDSRLTSLHVYVRNNVFKQWVGTSAIEDWASYKNINGNETAIAEYNSFLDVGRVAVRLPPGYTDASMSAISNYWGTTVESVIQSMIYDKNRDLNSAGVIPYKPFLTQPDPATPLP